VFLGFKARFPRSIFNMSNIIGNGPTTLLYSLVLFVNYSIFRFRALGLSVTSILCCIVGCLYLVVYYIFT